MTIRKISFLFLPVLLLVSFPVIAGTVTVTDGRGSWVSTKCPVPQDPMALPKDPETAANDMNAKMAVRSQYPTQADAYMHCISQEAEADANAANKVIIGTAQSLIQQMQAKTASMAPGAQ